MDLQHLLHAAEDATSVHHYLISSDTENDAASKLQIVCTEDPHLILSSMILVYQEDKLLNLQLSGLFGFLHIFMCLETSVTMFCTHNFL